MTKADPDNSCCSMGAHFSDKFDRKRVQGFVDQLGPDTWQFHDEGVAGGWIERDDEGEKKTRFMKVPAFC